jgi:hypothetical protein
MDSIFWFLGVLLVSYDFIIEVHRVDRDSILSGIVLQGTSEETMSEEELVDRVGCRHSFIIPLLEEFKTILQVFDVRAKFLQRWITLS